MLLNPDKSEVLLVACRTVAKSMAGVRSVNAAGPDISFQSKLKSLGVTLDSELSFSQHVQDIVKSCNFHLSI